MEPIKLINRSKEQNVAEMKIALDACQRELRESVKKSLGIDITDEKAFPVRERSFSWKKARAKLEEANVSSGFTQLLRAGVNNVMVGSYQEVPVTFEDWCTNISTGLEETLFAPLHGISFPREVGVLAKYPEQSFAGLDLKIRVRKFGSMLAIQKELLEDDQTGQASKMASLQAQYLRLLMEVYAYGKLSGAAASYQDLEIPASETKPSYETAYPWAPAATPLRGGAITKLAAAALNQGTIQNAFIQSMNQKNLLGIKMQVNADRIIASPYNKFNLATLLHSSYTPVGAATTGNVGGAFAINPIQSIADMTISRYVFDNTGAADASSKATYLVDSSVPWMVNVIRTPIEIVAEAPNSGMSFEQDVYRFRCSTRFNIEFIDPRFAIQMNDGSV